MLSATSYGSLSGSFRLTNKEYGAINYLRYSRRWNIAHIADILGRSLSTVHRVLTISNLERLDNRGRKQSEARSCEASYRGNKPTLRIQLKLWFDGYVDTLKQAMAQGVVSWTLVKMLLTENSIASQDEDPA